MDRLTPVAIIPAITAAISKGEPFKTFPAASETEIERFWETIQIVDDSVTHEDHTAEHIKRKVNKILINFHVKKLSLM